VVVLSIFEPCWNYLASDVYSLKRMDSLGKLDKNTLNQLKYHLFKKSNNT